MRFSLRKQILIQSGIAVLAVGLLVAANQAILVFLEKTSEKIWEQRTELLLRSRVSELLPTLRADAEKAKPLLAELNKMLPSKDGLINFGNRLIELGKKQKINLTFDAKGDIAPTDQTAGAIKFFITGEATYLNFTRFLKSIEQEPTFVKFISTSMQRKPGAGNFTVVADGEVYYQ